ncbi:hypothetical protein AAGR08_03400 [Pantoea sp. BRR-3P]|uniref:hypothetical protein n=1 Tax=Pantoea sp. BRR-3P TaxID=3141541 RepID=UPI0031F4C0AA
MYTRQNEKNKALTFLTEKQNVFIESGLGYGLSDFLYSIADAMDFDDSALIQIDLSEVISKKQLESKIKTDAGADISQIIFHYISHHDEKIILHFKNCSNDLDEDAVSYLRSLTNQISSTNPNSIIVFSSDVFIRAFRDISVKLDSLSYNEVSLILKNRFEERTFSHEELHSFHTLSEGIVKKLDRIIYYLDDASAQDVIEKKSLFVGVSYFETISEKTLKQIETLKTSTSDTLSFTLIKILSILKNGESLKNITKSKIGRDIDLDNIKKIVDMGIAKTIMIDNNTHIAKINPIVKDYIISGMQIEEINAISSEFLNITIVETKDGLKINSTNRRVLEQGYSTEGDNGCYLLVRNIFECKHNLDKFVDTPEEYERHLRHLSRLSTLSLRYVYALKNACVYNEVISSSLELLEAYGDTPPPHYYKYYLFIASSFRILGKYKDAKTYLEKCLNTCPSDDKPTLSECYVQELYLLEKTDEGKAIELAKRRKKEFRTSSIAHIVSDSVLSLNKPKQERIKSLTSLVRKSRKLNFHTLANNISLDLNKERKPQDRISSLDEVLHYETSSYNQCRALLVKYETFEENNMLENIKDEDIAKLRNVYNYLFNQRFDHLFKRCHILLWKIAEYRKNLDIIFMIYYKGQTIWILNNDTESEEEYSERFISLLN